MTQTQDIAVPALQITARTATLLTLRLQTDDCAAALATLDEQMQQAPSMFAGTPVTLDLSPLDRLPNDRFVQDFVAGLRARGVAPTALRGDAEALRALAESAGLGVLPGHGETNGNTASRTAPERTTQPAASPTRFVDKPIRSGQQIYAQGGDLVILASVGAGAEVVADGCIHIYGALNGRAIAGALGDSSARILCQQFNAELVSIAGQYQVGEEWSQASAGHPAQVYLEGDALIMERLEMS